MFTGIIEATAKILQKSDSGFVIARPAIFDDLKVGCSIAVSGVCLSVTAFDATSMSFDVIRATWQKTKLGGLNVGDNVNLERAMPANGRFEGHIVQGHCDAAAPVVSVVSGKEPSITVDVPRKLLVFIVLHGSVTVDGVALTVSALQEGHMTVSLIPHTLQITTLGSLRKGDRVNLETDILGKYILSAHAPR